MINEKIESIIIDNLKSKRIKFDQDDALFKLYIGSETSLIEYYPNETNSLEIAFFTREVRGGFLYDSCIYYEPESMSGFLSLSDMKLYKSSFNLIEKFK